MTGRLDAVDLPTDLLLIVLDRTPGSIQLGELYELYRDVDPDPFPFNQRSQSAGDFLESVGMFRDIGFLEQDGDLSRTVEVQITGRGRVMAEILEDELEEDQRQVVDEVIEA